MEEQNRKIPSNTDSDCIGNSEIYDRNSKSILLVKFIVAVKFLLFKEDIPKHKVWEEVNPIHLALILPLAIMLTIAFVSLGFVYYGFIGFFASYIGIAILYVEIPHILCDR